jgi:hypothetical protein
MIFFLIQCKSTENRSKSGKLGLCQIKKLQNKRNNQFPDNHSLRQPGVLKGQFLGVKDQSSFPDLR